ncbi:MAG: ribonuclease HII [Saprospiraceae bacterium]|nr:ribonuclease HII [Saprospiraceae bacterium]
MLQSSFTRDKLEAGCDEAGRGCLAGPVFAAAVILEKNYTHPFLRDSKKLSAHQRDQLFEDIQKEAIEYSIQQVSPAEIDEINILNASFLAMHRALDALKKEPELILVDGNRFKPYKKIPFECIIKGDDKFLSIAAASILAKVSRDRYMIQMDAQYPGYGWDSNMGYPTKAHRMGIQELGPSAIHRMSFRLLPENEQLELFNQK